MGLRRCPTRSYSPFECCWAPVPPLDNVVGCTLSHRWSPEIQTVVIDDDDDDDSISLPVTAVKCVAVGPTVTVRLMARGSTPTLMGGTNAVISALCSNRYISMESNNIELGKEL